MQAQVIDKTGIDITPLDRTKPEGRWSFNEDVAACFDNMLARSIPQYEAMRAACFALGKEFVRPGTAIVDLGCSRGEALAPYIKHFGIHNRYVGIEVSQPMAAVCRDRFANLTAKGLVDIQETDLRKGYPQVPASLTLSILTAQFIPIEHRQRVIRSVYRNTLPGGAFLIVEKVLGATSEIDEQMVARYYDLKRANGYSQEDIDRKRLSLEACSFLSPRNGTRRWQEQPALRRSTASGAG